MCPPDDLKRGKENVTPRISLNLRSRQLRDSPGEMTSNCSKSRASDSSSMHSAHLNHHSSNTHRMDRYLKKELEGPMPHSVDNFNNNDSEQKTYSSSTKQRRNNSAQPRTAALSKRINAPYCDKMKPELGERSLTLAGPMLRRSCTTMCPNSLNRTQGTSKVPLYSPSKETTMIKDNKGNYVRFRLASKNSCDKSTSSESNCASASSFPHITDNGHHGPVPVKKVNATENKKAPKQPQNCLEKRKRNFRSREPVLQQDLVQRSNKAKNTHTTPRSNALSSFTNAPSTQTRQAGSKLSKSKSKETLAQTLDRVSVQDTNGDCCEAEHEEMLDPDQVNRIMTWLEDCERALEEHEETAIVVHHLPAIGE
ncbi:uncharacterized protein LOC106158730 [Lingula anatina]|uniref:Uncharacterized protein LOC106158730 n=1 Tax=Lingula anatina TaxID=7574 RepID=A0A1S3IIY7_LINAN|nr:uncharacterized protein LOC106158730 [Lingula anatina]|eukprot:XP_013390264.1 uncharacterized protein LOC106158730 [Lingula anatina]